MSSASTPLSHVVLGSHFPFLGFPSSSANWAQKPILSSLPGCCKVPVRWRMFRCFGNRLGGFWVAVTSTDNRPGAFQGSRPRWRDKQDVWSICDRQQHTGGIWSGRVCWPGPDSLWSGWVQVLLCRKSSPPYRIMNPTGERDHEGWRTWAR